MASKKKTEIDHYQAVINFHKMTGIPVGKRPQMISRKAYARRMRLILEELSEYSEAVSKKNIVKIADALADILVVVLGTAAEHGLPMNKILHQVCESNMSKADGHMDRGGKWIKPDNYKPVDLSWLKKLAK